MCVCVGGGGCTCACVRASARVCARRINYTINKIVSNFVGPVFIQNTNFAITVLEYTRVSLFNCSATAIIPIISVTYESYIRHISILRKSYIGMCKSYVWVCQSNIGDNKSFAVDT